MVFARTVEGGEDGHAWETGKVKTPADVLNGTALLVESRQLKSIELNFRWKKLKKGPPRALDDTLALLITFNEYDYDVKVDDMVATCLYGERLSLEATRKLVTKMCNDRLRTIEEHIASKL